MNTDEALLSKARKLIEARLGWGKSEDWTNQDFISLSKKIQDEIRVSISHVTLKRIWGKVRYDSMPNTFTLSTLVQFIGYQDWRDFKVKHGKESGDSQGAGSWGGSKAVALLKNPGVVRKVLMLCIGAMAVISLIWFTAANKKEIDPDDYAFSARKIQAKGVPNSVVFDYDAARAPTDSVMIQLSWDEKRRTSVAKDHHQRTLIYYLPGFFEAKLVVAGKIVREQGILIATDGWLAAINDSPMPVYFKNEDAIADGRMALPVEKIEEQHISLVPQAPLLSYFNVQDFGEIYSDDFVFEADVRNDYSAGSSVCQHTNIYLLCEDTAVGIPLCAKGCTSDARFFFTGFDAPGKQHDLAAFGVDFREFVHVKVESSNGKAKVFLDDKLAYTVDHGITRARIIGIDFVFQGTGSIDNVSLSGGDVQFSDNFD